MGSAKSTSEDTIEKIIGDTFKNILKSIVKIDFNSQLTTNPSLAGNAEDTDLQNLQKEARGLTIINAREEEQQKVTNLIAPKTPEQEGDIKVPENTDPQNLQDKTQSLTIINAREEEQQKAANLIALKTSGQEEDTKVPEETDLQEVIPALDMVINKVFFLSRAGSLDPPSVPTARPTTALTSSITAAVSLTSRR